MAASIVQSKKGYFSGADYVDVAFTSSVTAGNSIVVVVPGYFSSPNDCVVTDTRTNTYTKRVNEKYATDANQGLQIFTAPNTTGGACTVRINPPNSTCWVSYLIIEVGGVQTASYDTANSAEDAGAGTTGNSGSVTPSVAGILIGAIEPIVASGSVTITIEANYTAIDEYEDGDSYIPFNAGYRLYSSADTCDWTFGSSKEWLGGIVVLKETASAGTTITVAEGASASAGDAVVLRAFYLLTVSQGNSASSGDPVVIRAVYSLVVSQGTSASAGDAVTLGVLHRLIVAEGTSASSGDAVSLGVLYRIIVAEGTSSSSGDAVTLSYGLTTTITVSEGNSASTGDAVTLGVLHRLLVAEGISSSTGDAVTVTFTGVGSVSITVSQGNSAVSGDPVTLGVLHGLTVSQGFSASIGDAVVIILAALILHGNRRTYEPSRATGYTNARQTHTTGTRKTYQEDD